MVLPLYDDNPSGRVPFLTILVIAVNVLIFVLVIVISSLGFIGVVLVRRIEAFVAPWSAAR